MVRSTGNLSSGTIIIIKKLWPGNPFPCNEAVDKIVIYVGSYCWHD